MDKHVLYVKLFGAFQMTYDDRKVIIERNDVTKSNQLFQILVCHMGGIQKEELIMYLFGNDSVVDPSNSLRGLIFRLRKALKAEGVIGGEYIKVDRGVYSLDPELKYDVDVLKFARLAESANSITDDYEKIKRLEQALDLYRGEVLPKLGAENWVIALREKYKNIYVRTVKQYVDLCMSKNEYQKIIDISTKAMRIYPFDEWQSYSMEALIALNRTTDAMQIYREAESRLQDTFGISLPDQMHEQMKEIGARVTNHSANLAEIVSSLDKFDEHSGAFECNYVTFAEYYQMIKYEAKRTSGVFNLMMISVTDSYENPLEDTARCKMLMDELVIALNRTLRKTDVFTRYSYNQVLIILKQNESDESETVFRRMKGNLDNSIHAKYYQYHVEEIQ